MDYIEQGKIWDAEFHNDVLSDFNKLKEKYEVTD